ncbi:hypothetical protein Sango_2925900 [Sesamum angolense]|uniref:Uncharacterized protein n=1 Tax=Sesamum angolense TaxID=2727404 RepID=A0AAE1VVF0_9LAMI|nr:hypothetical protein Sango_2925900 [Sesamum angolense]
MCQMMKMNDVASLPLSRWSVPQSSKKERQACFIKRKEYGASMPYQSLLSGSLTIYHIQEVYSHKSLMDCHSTSDVLSVMEIPSHPTGAINVGSYTTPYYTQNYSSPPPMITISNASQSWYNYVGNPALWRIVKRVNFRGKTWNFTKLWVKSGVKMPSTGFDPHMFPSSKKTIKGMLSKEGMKKVGKAVSKFFIFNALPFNAADSGPYMQSMIDTIVEVGPGVKGPSGESDDYYSPIDLNHIFHDNDILEEWTREAEELMLPENELDWLDEEGRMDNVPNDEDDVASLPLSRWSVPRSSKEKDGDDDDDNDGDGNMHKETHQILGMTWAQGDENYYATQDTDHGYRPGIENQCRFLSNLTDYSSQCDDSQLQRYGRRQPDIPYSMQNLEIDEHRPHQMHGHQCSSTSTNSGRSKTRRRNRGSATDSIGESNKRSSIETSHSSGTSTYSQGFGYYNQNMEHLMPSQPLSQVP